MPDRQRLAELAVDQADHVGPVDADRAQQVRLPGRRQVHGVGQDRPALRRETTTDPGRRRLSSSIHLPGLARRRKARARASSERRTRSRSPSRPGTSTRTAGRPKRGLREVEGDRPARCPPPEPPQQEPDVAFEGGGGQRRTRARVDGLGHGLDGMRIVAASSKSRHRRSTWRKKSSRAPGDVHQASLHRLRDRAHHRDSRVEVRAVAAVETDVAHHPCRTGRPGTPERRCPPRSRTARP